MLYEQRDITKRSVPGGVGFSCRAIARRVVASCRNPDRLIFSGRRQDKTGNDIGGV